MSGLPDRGITGFCEQCRKVCYVSRRAAKADALRHGARLSAYRCGAYWHAGHLPAFVVRGDAPRARGSIVPTRVRLAMTGPADGDRG